MGGSGSGTGKGGSEGRGLRDSPAAGGAALRAVSGAGGGGARSSRTVAAGPARGGSGQAVPGAARCPALPRAVPGLGSRLHRPRTPQTRLPGSPPGRGRRPGAPRWERSGSRRGRRGVERGGGRRPSGLPEINLPAPVPGRAGPAGRPGGAGERRRAAPISPGAVLVGEINTSKVTISDWRRTSRLHGGVSGLTLLRAGFLPRPRRPARSGYQGLPSACLCPTPVSQLLCLL